jgi:hypothetical protein
MNAELGKFILRSSLFFISLAILISLIVKIWPGSEILLFQEDGIIEDASAAVDTCAAMLGFYAIYLGVLKNRLLIERVILVTVPLLAAFCALDEISWGARIFDIEMPAMKGGGEFDGVHDAFVILERWIKAADPLAASLVASAVGAAVLLLVYRNRARIASFLHYSLTHSVARPLVFAICLLAFATVLDVWHGRIISSLEEFSELSAGLFLALAGFNSKRLSQPVNQEITSSVAVS